MHKVVFERAAERGFLGSEKADLTRYPTSYQKRLETALDELVANGYLEAQWSFGKPVVYTATSFGKSEVASYKPDLRERFKFRNIWFERAVEDAKAGQMNLAFGARLAANLKNSFKSLTMASHAVVVAAGLVAGYPGFAALFGVSSVGVHAYEAVRSTVRQQSEHKRITADRATARRTRNAVIIDADEVDLSPRRGMTTERQISSTRQMSSEVEQPEPIKAPEIDPTKRIDPPSPSNGLEPPSL